MISIIGGSGFVGSRLIELIGESKCVNLDIKPSPFFNNITKIADIRVKNDLNYIKNSESVILLAAEHKDNISPISKYYDVNVTGTQNVLDAMDKFGIKKIIFTSSVAVYGLNKNNPDENFIKDPFNHYGKSKWEAEKKIMKWYKNNPNGKEVVIIRPTVIFGERNRGNVYNLLKQIALGKFLMIGKGNNKKSMAYVGNVVEFIKQMLYKSSSGYEVYNYTDTPDITMNDLVNKIETKMAIKVPKIKIPYWIGVLGGYVFDFFSIILRKNLSISSVRVKKFCATTQFDSSKVKSFFNPPFTLDESIDRTLENEFINPPKNDNIFFYSE